MAQNIYLLTNEKTRPLADMIEDQVVINGRVISEDLILDETSLLTMARDCNVEYFYVIVTSKEIILTDLLIKFKPPYWDSNYVHMWNNDSVVRLFNTKMVLENPSAYTDESLANGTIPLKDTGKKVFDYPIFDIIFLSYNEFAADGNFAKLQSRFPKAKRVNGIKGIKEAHRAAAKISNTSMFYVVDADAEIIPGFDFNTNTEHTNINTAYIWHSRNPVNGLEYGYGGIKLLPTYAVLSFNDDVVDFTTSIADHVQVIEEVANITKFNTDPFSTWRSAFRECVKLSAGIIKGNVNKESEERLNIWCTVGSGEFGKFSIDGANKGARFGNENRDKPEMLRLINDFGWLEKKFNS